MKEPLLIRYYRALVRHWSSILAAISVTGFLVSYELHLPLHYGDLFLFLGANAVLWTLVEIRISLRTRQHPTRFPNMRTARPFILSKLRDTLARRHKSNIKIIGGRIRTISDMLREIVVAIQRGDIRARNTRISVYCLDPEFVVTEMEHATLRDASAFKVRFEGYGDLIRQFSTELETYNGLLELRDQKIAFDVILYRSLPWFYGFLIDQTDLFWGFFTWNSEAEDFDGPPNPCFELTEQSEYFKDHYGWLENRSALFELTGRRIVGSVVITEIAGKETP